MLGSLFSTHTRTHTHTYIYIYIVTCAHPYPSPLPLSSLPPSLPPFPLSLSHQLTAEEGAAAGRFSINVPHRFKVHTSSAPRFAVCVGPSSGASTDKGLNATVSDSSPTHSELVLMVCLFVLSLWPECSQECERMVPLQLWN